MLRKHVFVIFLPDSLDHDDRYYTALKSLNKRAGRFDLLLLVASITLTSSAARPKLPNADVGEETNEKKISKKKKYTWLYGRK